MGIIDSSLKTLYMDSRFQMFLSTLTTMLPPFIVWLVLKSLTADLRNLAAGVTPG